MSFTKRHFLNALLFLLVNDISAKRWTPFISQPANTTGVEGSTVIIKCMIDPEVSTKADVVWLIGGKVICFPRRGRFSYKDSNFQTTGDYSLRVEELSLIEDDGLTFQCAKTRWSDPSLLRHRYVNVTSNTATLSVVTGVESVRLVESKTYRELAGTVTVIAGEKESFTCEALNSKPAAEITWKLDGSDVTVLSVNKKVQDRRTGKWTTISKLTKRFHLTENKRQLSCRVYVNERLPAVIVRAMLEVQYIDRTVIVVNAGSFSNSLTEGDTLNLLCSAIGNPQLKYTWFRMSNGTTTVLLDHHGRSLTKKASVQDSGTYWCDVQNVLGTSASYNVINMTVVQTTVTELFTVHPTDTTGVEGQPVVIRCDLDLRHNNVHADWSMNGNKLKISSSGEYVYDDRNYVTTGNYSLRIERLNVTQHDSSTFVCQAKSINMAGEFVTTFSAPAIVTVLASPESVTIQQRHDDVYHGHVVTVTTGEKEIFHCSAQNSKPGSSVTWLLGDNDVTDSATQQQTPGTVPKKKTTTSTLTLEVQVSHQNRTLTCRVQTPGEIKPTDVAVRLDVFFLSNFVNITTFNQNVNFLPVGGVLRMECGTSGNPTPRYNWYREINSRVELLAENSSRLVRRDVTPDDAATYWCEAENSAGRHGSPKVAVNVNVAESVSVAKTTIICAFAALVFLCVVLNVSSRKLDKEEGSRGKVTWRLLTRQSENKEGKKTDSYPSLDPAIEVETINCAVKAEA